MCPNISLQLNELYISIYQAREVSNEVENIESNKRVIGRNISTKESEFMGA